MIAPKRLESSAALAANSAGLIGAGTPPSAVMRSFSAGVARMRLISLFSRCDHGVGRAGRRIEAEHGVGVEALQPEFVERGHVGKQRRTLRAAHCDHAQLARAHVRDGDARVEEKVELAAEQVGQRRRGAAVGHVHGKGAGLRLHHLGGQVRRAAVARRAEAALAGVGLQIGEEGLEVLRRAVRAHHQEDQHTRRRGHRHQVLGRVEGHARIDVRIDRDHAAAAHQQRVAVRR